MRRSRRPAFWALAISFAVYFVPIIGPHTGTLLGWGLFQEISGRGGRPTGWIAADIAFALALQSVIFVLAYWFLKNPSLLSGLVCSGCFALVLPVIPLAYMVAIPSMFLIEKDTSTDTGSFPEVCSADDATMVAVPMPRVRTNVPMRQVLVQSSQGRYMMLVFEGCRVVPLSVPQPTVHPGGRVDFMLAVNYVVPGIGVLFNTTQTSNGAVRWAVLRDGDNEPVPLDLLTPVPILSGDGQWVAWIQRDEGSPPRPSRIHIRPVEGARVLEGIDLSSLGTKSLTLLNFDTQSREALIHDGDSFITVDFEGNAISGIKPDGVGAQSQTFLRMAGGWVAWDAYQERDRYRVRWEFPGGSGSHGVPLGRGISAVSANPLGTMVAVSVSTALNIGSFPDAVYVLKAGDGSEVFRRSLPRFSRSEVIFPDDQLFAYSSEGKTHVLRVVP